jgi:hypothetical protein
MGSLVVELPGHDVVEIVERNLPFALRVGLLHDVRERGLVHVLFKLHGHLPNIVCINEPFVLLVIFSKHLFHICHRFLLGRPAFHNLHELGELDTPLFFVVVLRDDVIDGLPSGVEALSLEN